MTDFVPLQGSPDDIASAAAAMSTTAEVIRQAAAVLSQFSNLDVYVSESITAVTANATELAGVLNDANSRYQGAADALQAYAPVLRDAQQKALAAIRAHDNTNVGHAQSQVNHYELELFNPTLNQTDRDYYHHQLHFAQAQLHDQQSAANAAATAYEEAVQERDQAAHAAAQQLQDAMVASQLNDSFADKLDGIYNDIVKPALKKALAWLDNALEDVSKLLDVLSLVALVVALFAPEFAVPALAAFAALRALAAGVSYIQLGVKIERFALGDITLGDLVLAGIGAALSYFGGKLAGRGITKLARRGALDHLNQGGLKVVAGSIHLGSDKSADLTTKAAKPLFNTWDYRVPDDAPPIGLAPVLGLQPVLGFAGSSPFFIAHELRHNDVAPVTVDFTRSDVNQIVDTTMHSPSLTCESVTASPAPAGGGGGGW